MYLFINLYTSFHKYLRFSSHQILRCAVCINVCVHASSSQQPAESSSENLLPPRHDQFSLNATDRWVY